MFGKQRIIQRLIKFYIPVFALLTLSLEIVIRAWYPEGISPNELFTHRLLFGSAHILWLISFTIFELPHTQRFRNKSHITQTLLLAFLINVLLAVLIFYIQPNLDITPRRFLLIHSVTSLLFVGGWISLVHTFNTYIGLKHVIFFGDTESFNTLKADIQETKDHLVQKITHAKNHTLPTSNKKTAEQTIILFSKELPTEKAFTEQIGTLCKNGAVCMSLSHYYEHTLQRVWLNDISREWLFEFGHRPADALYLWIKRFIDFLAGVLFALILLILVPFILFLNIFLNKGPLFFFQKRSSLDGTSFTIYKLRTMRYGTKNDTWTQEHDERITPFGHVLRKTRIDELPQALNLLKGDMSLVGPRPEQVNITQTLAEQIPFYQARHIIRPGLAGWAQLHVYARTQEDSKKKLQYDLYYLKHRSLLFDLEIMAKTFIHVMRVRGV